MKRKAALYAICLINRLVDLNQQGTVILTDIRNILQRLVP